MSKEFDSIQETLRRDRAARAWMHIAVVFSMIISGGILAGTIYIVIHFVAKFW